MTLTRHLVGEGLGTAFLLIAVVGSGIMAERLAGGNEATFTGIGQGDVPGFLLAQGIAILVAIPLFAWIFRERPKGSG